ncbi:MAG: hypothetical protein MK213_07890, partial [Planctomycetes bacterium]|nr:hypothetical protein [Planctomycetota bacterium]
MALLRRTSRGIAAGLLMGLTVGMVEGSWVIHGQGLRFEEPLVQGLKLAMTYGLALGGITGLLAALRPTLCFGRSLAVAAGLGALGIGSFWFGKGAWSLPLAGLLGVVLYLRLRRMHGRRTFKA